MRKYLFALTIVVAVLGSSSTFAADVAVDDIIGRWCVDNGNQNVFTRTQLTVIFPNNSQSIFKIEKIDAKGARLYVQWERKSVVAAGSRDWGKNITGYELSADKRILIQLPGETGDKGPRRQLRRC